MPYSSYSNSGDTVTRTLNAYSFSGETKLDRYKGAVPTDLAEKVWIYPPYAGQAGGELASGGGISIFTKP